jgi:hypothetical protein
MRAHHGVDPHDIFAQFFDAQRAAGRRGGGGAQNPFGNGTAFRFGSFGGAGNGASFFVNGVPVGGGARRRARSDEVREGQEDGGAREVQIPPFVKAILETVPPPLLVMAFFFGAIFFVNIASAVLAVLMSRMHVIMPILWFAPDRAKLPLIAAVCVLSAVGGI